MKSFKLLLAAALICVSQFAMAYQTTAELAAYNSARDAAVAAGANATQAQVQAAIDAASAYGIDPSVAVTALARAGVPQSMIVNAMNINIAAGSAGSSAPNCSPACASGTAGTAKYSVAGVNALGSTGAGFQVGNGQTGAVGVVLSFSPAGCATVSCN